MYAGKASRPPAGAVSTPVFEYCSVCGVPTSVPSMASCEVHWLAVAVFTKYIVPVCVAPSESNSVSEVAWLKEFGSLGLNTATGGGVALAGRLSTYSTLAVACGAESVVTRRRSERPPVLKPPPASGGYTCRRWPWN